MSAGLVTSTVTPGSAPPEESRTKPTMAPVVASCPDTTAAISRNEAKPSQTTNRWNMTAPFITPRDNCARTHRSGRLHGHVIWSSSFTAGHTVVNDHIIPAVAAFVPEAVVDLIELIVLVRTRVTKHQHERMRIRGIHNGAPRISRGTEISRLNRFNREQRVHPVDESFPRRGRQIRFQPEIHRVDEHGYSRRQGPSFKAMFFIWLPVNASGCRHDSMPNRPEMPSGLRQTDRTRSAAAPRSPLAPGNSGTRKCAARDTPSARTR